MENSNPIIPESSIIEMIKEIQDAKRASKQAPDYASIIEIENSLKVELKETLNKLVSKGAVKWFKTLNGTPMFSAT
jgi:hypothetical protein